MAALLYLEPTHGKDNVFLNVALCSQSGGLIVLDSNTQLNACTLLREPLTSAHSRGRGGMSGMHYLRNESSHFTLFFSKLSIAQCINSAYDDCLSALSPPRLLGSITVLCSAAMSNFISNWLNGDVGVLFSPVPYLLLPILVSTALLQMQQLNEAQKYHDSSKVVPVYYICFTLCSIIGSGVVYQDFLNFELNTALGFALGVCACFSGVYLITKRGTVADTYGIKERPKTMLSHLASGPEIQGGHVYAQFRDADEDHQIERRLRFEGANPELLSDLTVPTRLRLFISTQLDRQIMAGRQDASRRGRRTRSFAYLDTSTVKHFVPLGAVNQAIRDSRMARKERRGRHRRTTSEPAPRSPFFPPTIDGEVALL